MVKSDFSVKATSVAVAELTRGASLTISDHEYRVTGVKIENKKGNWNDACTRVFTAVGDLFAMPCLTV